MDSINSMVGVGGARNRAGHVLESRVLPIRNSSCSSRLQSSFQWSLQIIHTISLFFCSPRFFFVSFFCWRDLAIVRLSPQHNISTKEYNHVIYVPYEMKGKAAITRTPMKMRYGSRMRVAIPRTARHGPGFPSLSESNPKARTRALSATNVRSSTAHSIHAKNVQNSKDRTAFFDWSTNPVRFFSSSQPNKRDKSSLSSLEIEKKRKHSSRKASFPLELFHAFSNFPLKTAPS